MDSLHASRAAVLLALLAGGCSNAAAPDLSQAPNSSFGVTKDQFQAEQNGAGVAALPMAGMVAEPAPQDVQAGSELPPATPLPAATDPELPVLSAPDAGVAPVEEEHVAEPPPEEPTNPLWPFPLPEEEEEDDD